MDAELLMGRELEKPASDDTTAEPTEGAVRVEALWDVQVASGDQLWQCQESWRPGQDDGPW